MSVGQPPHSWMNWRILPTFAFIFYALTSFAGVSGYIVEQYRTRRLLDGIHTPRRISMPGGFGAVFVFCVLGLFFAQSILAYVLVVFGLTLVLLGNGRTANEQFGLDRLPWEKLVKWSFLVCGAVVFVEFPLGLLVDRGMDALHFPHPEQESVEMFRHTTKPVEILAFLIQAVFLSPLIEELFFRGFLFTFLKNYTTTALALVLSAGVFAFVHANLGSVLQLWLLGLVLGLAYEYSGSLLLAMGIHACWNFMTALSLLLDRGTG